jgi:methyl-accepting chemotaxis protein
MQQTRSSVELVGRNINQLALHLRRIGQIIASVSDIATQSNFLALNAQIEAARAGERGRGFTIVADEVRDLADQSRQSTSDVRTILKEIQRAIAEAVDVTERGANGVNMSLHQAEEAGQIIGQLNETIISNNASSEEILEAIDRQMTDVNKLVESMQTLNQVAMQNQASSRMAETISQNLSRLSAKLVGTILQAESETKHSSQEMRGVE